MARPTIPTEPRPEGGWTKIDNDVIEHVAFLGPMAFAVFCVLAKFARGSGECWPSLATIGAQAGISKNGVRIALRILADAKLVAVVKRFSPQGDAMSSIYRLSPWTDNGVNEGGARGEPGWCTG